MNSQTCTKYFKRLNDEIAFGEFYHDEVLKIELKKVPVSVERKAFYGVPQGVSLSMYDVSKTALDVLPMIRFIYLTSLVEAFVEDYINERSGGAGVTFEDASRPTRSRFDKLKKSKSSYSIEYVAALLSDLYGIDLDAHLGLRPFMEMGQLRNCIVHDAGLVSSDSYLASLRHTATFLSTNLVVGTRIEITKNLMAEMIEGFRSLLRFCDYA